MADEIPRALPSRHVSSGTAIADEEQREFPGDLEQASTGLPSKSSSADNLVAVTGSRGQSIDVYHEMITMGPSVTSEWKWIGEKELHELLNNRRSRSDTSSATELAIDLRLGASAPVTESREAGENGAYVRMVTEGSGEPSGEGPRGDEGKQTIAHILLPTAAVVSPGSAGNGRKEDHPRKQSVVGKKRKVASIIDFHSSLLHRDLEKGIVCNEAIGGGDPASSEHDVDGEEEPQCRVCHLSTASVRKIDVIDLGCACKLDLGRAHKACAETWFQVRGNRQCEICGETAKNVHLLEPMNDSTTISGDTTITVIAVPHPQLACWQNRPIRRCLLVCLIAAFVIPWLFRFAYYQ